VALADSRVTGLCSCGVSQILDTNWTVVSLHKVHKRNEYWGTCICHFVCMFISVTVHLISMKFVFGHACSKLFNVFNFMYTDKL
jgi:hypothetical protein